MGELHIIFGPMFSGKSSELIRIISVYQELDMKVLYINSSLNNRPYITHSGVEFLPKNTITQSTLETVDVKDYEIVVIDEAQFFPDITKVISWVNEGKIVFVAGLIADYKREKFGHIYDLIPHADSITKLSSFCISCKKAGRGVVPAHFTKRIECQMNGSCDNQILIGGKDRYIAVCRKCL